MGNTYEINIWQRDEFGYKYESVWRGENLLVAIYKMWQYKKSGIGCVKLEWR